MQKDLIRENLELKLTLFQTQGQLLTLQNEKLEALFKGVKQELDNYLASKETYETDK